MECIFCGGEFYSSREADKVCTTCERAIERLHIGMTPDRLFELSQAEQAGRLVVANVSGRWISDRFGNLWCSSCKHCGSSDGIETIYCPNCGAKMDGEV